MGKIEEAYDVQAWSITYHSWTTFVLLLGACAIWIMPAKRALCQRLSPVITLYAEALVILQYIYAFRLHDSELPVDTASGYHMEEIGMLKYEYPVRPLCIKVSATCCGDAE